MSITSVRSKARFPSLDAFSWPGDFARIPDEEWTRQPVDQFGLNYDDVGSHGWYKNLEPTISQVLATLAPGGLLIDYSQRHGHPDEAPDRLDRLPSRHTQRGRIAEVLARGAGIIPRR